MTRTALLSLATLALAACSSGLTPTDGAVAHDAGPRYDSNLLDGPSTDDTGTPPTDAPVANDTGTPPVDGGPHADAPCVELGFADPWQNRISGHTLADRGQILACVHVGTVARDVAAASPYLAPLGNTADNGFDAYVIQYVSEGSPGVPRAVTALAYFPTGTTRNLPIAAVTHGTSGMGPSCGVTHTSAIADYMSIPLVARGYAVIATDYAGMGVDDGISPYLVGDGPAYNTLDSVRALRRLNDARVDLTRLGTDFFVMGHSQGGQIALFTHQRIDDSLGLRMLGSISFAPGLGDLRGFNLAYGASRQIDTLGVFLVMGLYGNMDYHRGPDPSTFLRPDALSALPGMLHDQCLTQLFTSIPARWPTQGDIFTPAFLSAAQNCTFLSGSCPGFEPWSDYLVADVPGAFTSPAPALLIQGERDTIVSPAGTNCVARRLAMHGTTAHACGYASDDHLTIVSSAIADALRWMTARRAGQDPNVCPAPIAEACP